MMAILFELIEQASKGLKFMRSIGSSNWQQLCCVAAIFACAVLLTLIISSTANAQDQKPTVVPIKEGQPTVNPPVKPNPLDDDKTVNWTLNDAISTALENNVDISIERKNVRIAELSLRAAEGVYDPVFTASPTFTSNVQPNIGRFS